ncbi:MAG TPA: glycosyl transferase family 2 [Ktedonobacter sp.]|nr:glycosyl transferase family 2 [Ktedonobacter sp.]
MCQVSVVVPTYKHPELLQCCLNALIMQDFEPDEYEIIIVDDANCEETCQQVLCWVQQVRTERLTKQERMPMVCYIPVETSYHGPAIARNLGWKAARSPIIAFTDDDCIPFPDWLTKGVEAFSTSQHIAAVSGRVIMPLPETPTDYEYNAAHLETCEFVTANCFYRRDVLLDMGGFDERFTMAWREDSDLFFTLLKHGKTYVCAPEVQVLHPVRPASWGVSIHQQRKSMFNALLYKKHPTLYRERIQAAPPWHYYGIVLALLMGMFGLIRRSELLMVSGFGLWGWFTARFCMHRLEHTSHAPSHIVEMIVTSVLIPPLAIFWRIVGMFKFRVPFL